MRIKGVWKYLYRAVDKAGATVDFLLTAKRDRKAALRFLRKAIGQNGTPEKITIAVSVYVLVAIVRKRLSIQASLYTLMQVFSVAIFEKIAMRTAFLPGVYGSDGDIENKQLNLFGF